MSHRAPPDCASPADAASCRAEHGDVPADLPRAVRAARALRVARARARAARPRRIAALAAVPGCGRARVSAAVSELLCGELAPRSALAAGRRSRRSDRAVDAA